MESFLYLFRSWHGRRSRPYRRLGGYYYWVIVLAACLYPALGQATTARAESCTYVSKWGSFGAADGRFNRPASVAVDSSGHVYVADSNNNRLQKFSSTGSFLLKWGGTGTGDGQFRFPNGVTVDASGNILVADSNNNRIQKFDSNGTFLLKWGSFGTADGLFTNPVDLGAGVDHVFVLEPGGRRVQKFSNAGAFVSKWGQAGSGNGQFEQPNGIAVDAAGNVYVADTSNNRIQKFSSTGVFLAKWGSFGTGNGQFDQPLGIAVDGAGDVYVADSNNHRLQKFTSDGAFLFSWGALGTGDGLFNRPRDVTADATGNVFVADTSNNRIQTIKCNQSPIAVRDGVDVSEDSASNVLSVLGNDRELDGDPLTITNLSAALNGVAATDGSTISYTPNPEFNGTDSFLYAVSDGRGATVTGTVVVTVTGVNDAPTVQEQAVSQVEDQPLAITLVGSDNDSPNLSYSVVDAPAYGVLSAPNGASITYIPNDNFHGSDSFTFKANDGLDDSAVATVTVTVDAVNDAPTAQAQNLGTSEDGTLDVVLQANDVDGEPITYTLVSLPQNGQLTGAAPNLAYQPQPNFYGEDQFSFSVSDGLLESDVTTVTITVGSVNDAPLAVDDEVGLLQENTIEIDVLSNDSDADGDPLTISAVAAAHGTAIHDATLISYTPASGFSGTDVFTYTISDGNSGSASATVTVTVTPVSNGTSSITIVLDKRPENKHNVRFSGTLGGFALDDAAIDDGDKVTSTRTFSVTAGSYRIKEKQPSGRVVTAINCNDTADVQIDLAAAELIVNVAEGQPTTCTFVNERPASIRGKVYHDRNQNGVRNGHENVQSGWELTVYISGTTEVVGVFKTNNGGDKQAHDDDDDDKVTLKRLRPGSYTVCETLKKQWVASDPAVIDPLYAKPCRSITLAAGQGATLWFGNYKAKGKALDNSTSGATDQRSTAGISEEPPVTDEVFASTELWEVIDEESDGENNGVGGESATNPPAESGVNPPAAEELVISKLVFLPLITQE